MNNQNKKTIPNKLSIFFVVYLLIIIPIAYSKDPPVQSTRPLINPNQIGIWQLVKPILSAKLKSQISPLLIATSLPTLLIQPAYAIPCSYGCFEGANCCGTEGVFNGKGYIGCQDSSGNWHCPGSPLGLCLECVCESKDSCSWVPRNELCFGCQACDVTNDGSGNPISSSCIPREGCQISDNGTISCLSFGQSKNNICCIQGQNTVFIYNQCFQWNRQNPANTSLCYYGNQTNICDATTGWACLNSPVDKTRPTDCSFSAGATKYFDCAGKFCGDIGWSCGDPINSSTVDTASCKICSNSACTHGQTYPTASNGCWSDEISKCCIKGQTWKPHSKYLNKLLISQICVDGYYYIRFQGKVTYYLMDAVLPEEA